MKFTLVSGTGNVFALFDGFAAAAPGDGRSGGEPGVPEDPASAARELCAAPLDALPCVRIDPPSRLRLDGILLLLPPREHGDCRMVIHNADGSRPESCGNGLRTIALVARARGHVPGDAFTIETDSGLRAARVLRARPGDPAAPIVGAEIAMGEPRGLERRVTLKTGHGALEATLVDMGNPHCVVFVRDERETPVERLGPEIERHRRFPARTNVEFVAVRSHGLDMRVWERGVGETAACGTGACAAAVAAAITQRSGPEVDVRLPGGVLHVAWDAPDGEVRLSGPCEVLGAGEWRPAALEARKAR